MSGPISLIPPQYGTPAPNAYGPNYKLLSKSVPALSLSSRWKEQAKTSQVCPLSYAPQYKVVDPDPYAFTCRRRHASTFRRNTPAPNAYSVSAELTMPRAPASTLSSRRRYLIESTPAPNAYDVKFKDTTKQAPQAVFATPRRPSVFKSATEKISSATYSGDYRVLRRRPAEFSLRSRTPMQTDKDRTAGVGPAKYSTQIQRPKDRGFTLSGWNAQGFNIW